MAFFGFREDLHAYVRENLKGRYRLGLLTNHIRSWLEPFLEEQGLNETFDTITTSYEAGVAKPDKSIYEKALGALEAAPEECVYIDDRPKNLEPARELGMRTIHFRSLEQFKEELEAITPPSH